MPEIFSVDSLPDSERASSTPVPDSTGKAVGTLYVVPTPIGNLQDITERARNVLLKAATIAAEDTRRCLKLLQLLDIRKDPQSQRVIALHEHNEAAALEGLVQRLCEGETVALVSDVFFFKQKTAYDITV